MNVVKCLVIFIFCINIFIINLYCICKFCIFIKRNSFCVVYGLKSRFYFLVFFLGGKSKEYSLNLICLDLIVCYLLNMFLSFL